MPTKTRKKSSMKGREKRALREEKGMIGDDVKGSVSIMNSFLN